MILIAVKAITSVKIPTVHFYCGISSTVGILTLVIALTAI